MSAYRPGFLHKLKDPLPLIPDSTDQLLEGNSNLYFTVARVLATMLTGLDITDKSQLLATDTILQAFGKLQAQIIAGKILIEDWGLITNAATELRDYGVITAAATEFEDYEDIVYGG